MIYSDSQVITRLILSTWSSSSLGLKIISLVVESIELRATPSTYHPLGTQWLILLSFYLLHPLPHFQIFETPPNCNRLLFLAIHWQIMSFQLCYTTTCRSAYKSLFVPLNLSPQILKLTVAFTFRLERRTKNHCT